jgi:hypothetical protein
VEAPGLSRLQVTADGSLQALGELEPKTGQNQAADGEVILLTHLLGLFLTFLGGALTVQLVGDVSPNLKLTMQSATSVPFGTILQEAHQLKEVSERLELLADQHSFVQDALISISGNIRDTATLLEVFVQIRSKSDGPQTNALKQAGRRYEM